MNRYILNPDDRIRVLPPQSGEPAMIELFCGRTMIFFELSAPLCACMAHGVPFDGGTGDALRFAGADTLLGAQHEVYVPAAHADFAAFSAALRQLAPELCAAPAMEYVKEACGHKGPRHA